MAADEVWRLQNGKDAECQFFQVLANQGHYKDHATSRQGFYICSPSGKFLGSINSTRPEQIIKLMDQGLRKWNALDESDRTMPDASMVQQNKRYETAEPIDGMVLAIYTRDLPEDADPTSIRGKKWNRDTIWFSKDEVREMTPYAAKVGQQFEFPKLAVNRIAALHFVDMVVGQTEPFRNNEIVTAKIHATISKVRGTQIELQLEGETRTNSDEVARNKTKRGIATRLLGSAIFDTAKQSFSKFEIVAVGRRWGHTQFNSRRYNQHDTNQVGFVLQLAPDNEPPNVPAFIWRYNAEWVNKNRK